MGDDGSSTWDLVTGTASLVYDNQLFIIGDIGSSRLNDAWCSPDWSTWSLVTGTAAWSGRSDHTSVVYNNQMFAMGGNGGSLKCINVWSLSDGATWAWASSTAGWCGRSGHTSVVYDNQMFDVSPKLNTTISTNSMSYEAPII